MGHSWDFLPGNSWIFGNIPSFQRGSGCPGQWWNPNPWSCSQSVWGHGNVWWFWYFPASIIPWFCGAESRGNLDVSLELFHHSTQKTIKKTPNKPTFKLWDYSPLLIYFYLWSLSISGVENPSHNVGKDAGFLGLQLRGVPRLQHSSGAAPGAFWKWGRLETEIFLTFRMLGSDVVVWVINHDLGSEKAVGKISSEWRSSAETLFYCHGISPDCSGLGGTLKEPSTLPGCSKPPLWRIPGTRN